MIFQTVKRSTLILACLLPVHADEVRLADGSRLSGTVTAMTPAGQVSLSSPLAFEPFQLRADRLRRLQFSQDKKSTDDHDAMLVLTNGDQFACDLRGIDEDSIQVETSFAGLLDIPRDRVSTAQLGVRPRKLIYRGPDNEAGWTVRNGWKFSGKRFETDGNGTLSRSFDTPGSFALRFRLTWRSTPNIQIYFADDMLETTGKADRYHLSFDSSGFQLKRQQSGDNFPNKDMQAIRREPASFPESKVDVELRVDRALALVHVYLNGEFEGKYADPLKSAPTGQGVMFLSKIGGDDSMVIDNIEVREWDAAADRHRSETRGDETKDVVITRSSDRSTGSIIGLRDGKDGQVVLYKSPHYPEPMELPASEVSTLFFARPENPPVVPQPPMLLGLRNRGSLGVTGCAFEGDVIKADHPLLGNLAIRRNSVSHLERAAETDQKPEPPKPDAEEEEEDEE